VVDLSVVVSAEQHQVVEAGGPTVCPVDDVVGVAPPGRPSTDHTAPVPDLESTTQRRGNRPAGPPHIENGGVGVDGETSERRIAGEEAGPLGGDDPGTVQLARLGRDTAESFGGDVEGEVGPPTS